MMKEDKVMEKEEEDTTFDGGFIKVEKEGIDIKSGSIEEQKQVSIERSSSGSQQREQDKSQETLTEQESINLKLKEELKNQEGKLRTANENLTIVVQEKQVLETDMADIRAKTKEICHELEEKLKISDEKYSRKEADLSQALSKNSDLEQKLKSLEELSKQVSELKSALMVAEEEEKKSTSQMQEHKEKVTKLESSLNQSSERNAELEEDLRIALQRGAEHEDIGKVSTQRCVELHVKNSSLETTLSVAMEKDKEISENLNAVMEKLKSAEERLEKQARERDENTKKRSIELGDMELRIQKAMENFNSRDTEAKSLTEKSKDLEERIRLYQGKLAEASGQSLSLKEELYQSSSDNELLADTNNQLKIKIQELEGYLDAEKETANEKFKQRDRESKDLVIMLKAHENLIEEHKRQVLEASGVADTRKVELDDALLKLKTLETTIKELEQENGYLAEVNINLNQELANHGSETSDIQAMLSASKAEKYHTAKELQESKTAIEDLTKKLSSEGERLRSQISSLGEENNQVNEIYQSTKNELVKLQEQLQQEKSKSDDMVSEIEKLSAEAAEKLVLKSNFEQVEKHLKEVEAQMKEEVEKVAELTSKLQEHEDKARDRNVLDEQAIKLHKELLASHDVISEQKETVSQKHSVLEATLKTTQEELEAKNSMIFHLESLLKELEQKVQLADAKYKEMESTGKGETEVKSREIDLSFSTPKQRKTPPHSSSSGNVTIQKGETSHLMTLKIVLGVALVSIFIGIILGKKY